MVVATVALVVACRLFDSRPPHIILISVDTLRWDYLGAYGYPEPEISPTINWLAKQGTLFEQAVTTAGTTIPSHGSMLTGLYPRQHGARSNKHGLNPEAVTLAAELSASGYQTGAFASVRFLAKIGKLNRGFQADNLAAFNAKKGWNPQSADETIGQVDDWLDALDRESPFFLFIHLWEPHSPFDLSGWAEGRLGNYDGFLRHGVSTEDLVQRVDEIKRSPEDIRAMRTIYAGEVNRLDKALEGLFVVLRDRELLADSVIIFTSDHGEGLGEGDFIGHGATYNEHVLRVPLIVADFRDIEPQRVSTRVGTIDIAATVADLAGLENRFDWHGDSLMDPASLDPAKSYFAEVEFREETLFGAKSRDSWYDPDAVGIWAGDLKLVEALGRKNLFETSIGNRLPRPVDPLNESIMYHYLVGQIETFREIEKIDSPGEISDSAREELQGLGYVQ